MDVYYKKYIKYKTKYVDLRDQIGSANKKKKNSGTQPTPPQSNPINCLEIKKDRIHTFKSRRTGKDITYNITTISNEIPVNPKDYENKDSRDKVFFNTFIQNKKNEVKSFNKIIKIVLTSKSKTYPYITTELLCFTIGGESEGRRNDGPIDHNITDQIIDKITKLNEKTRDPPKYFIVFQSESSNHKHTR